MNITIKTALQKGKKLSQNYHTALLQTCSKIAISVKGEQYPQVIKRSSVITLLSGQPTINPNGGMTFITEKAVIYCSIFYAARVAIPRFYNGHGFIIIACIKSDDAFNDVCLLPLQFKSY